MCKSIIYDMANYNTFSDYEKFKGYILQKVKSKWKRTGNSVLGLSDAKVHRVFTGKQDDFDTIMKMADFMQISIRFTVE